MKKLLTLLLVLVVVVGATATIGFAAGTESLTANVSSKTITQDTVLDLAGHSIGTLTVESGVTVTISGAGETGAIGTISGEGTIVAADNYLLLNGDGNIHKLTIETYGVALRANDLEGNGASMYYVCRFGGDQYVKNLIEAYGTALGAGREPNFRDSTYTKITDLSKWNTDEPFLDNGVLLKGIMRTSNAYSANRSNAGMQVTSLPYVDLQSGVRVKGVTQSRSLKEFVEVVTSNEENEALQEVYWDSDFINYEGKLDVVELYYTFERVMKLWVMDRLDPLVKKSCTNYYPLYNPSDVKLMCLAPYADFKLMDYIDMEGETIDGIEGFTGSIDGDGHTIYNFTINGVGLVDTVEEGETINDLYLHRVNVVVPADSEVLNVGTIAGTNNGTITGVSAAGTVKDTRAGSEGAEINAGALVGLNNGTLSTYANVTVTQTDVPTVTGAEQTFTTEGLSADVGLFMNETSGYINRGLVGAGNAVANPTTVYWRDNSYSTERQAQALQDRRQTAVDYVYQSGTIKWTVPFDIVYYADQKNYPNMEKPSNWLESFISGKWHIHNQRFTKGETYLGMPYTHCSSSLEQAQYYMTKGANDVYTLKNEVAEILGGSNNLPGNSTWANGGIGWGKYLGSDCSSALTMAWQKVSQIITSTKTNGGVCMLYTTDTVPSQAQQYYYGFRQVGDYEVDDKAISGGVIGTDSNGNNLADLSVTVNSVTTKYPRYKLSTDMIIQDIIDNQGGIQTVYEAYAQAQMGDIMVSGGTVNAAAKAGHVRMLAQDAVVIRNGEGDINPAKSYFLTHEQGDGLYDRETTNSSWRINYKYTFEQFARQTDVFPAGSNGYYLPITMPAFHNANLQVSGGLASGGTVINGNNPLKYALNSSYRIQCATMIIKDAQGNTKYEKTAFQGTSSNQNRVRAVPGNIPLYANDLFSDCCDNLVDGQTYYVTLSGTTFPGVTDVKMNNYKIVYDPDA